jgi:hypothetical protein
VPPSGGYGHCGPGLGGEQGGGWGQDGEEGPGAGVHLCLVAAWGPLVPKRSPHLFKAIVEEQNKEGPLPGHLVRSSEAPANPQLQLRHQSSATEGDPGRGGQEPQWPSLLSLHHPSLGLGTE